MVVLLDYCLIERTSMDCVTRCVSILRAFLVVAVGSSFVAGCRASMAPDAGFVPQPELLHPDARLPFDAV